MPYTRDQSSPPPFLGKGRGEGIQWIVVSLAYGETIELCLSEGEMMAAYIAEVCA